MTKRDDDTVRLVNDTYNLLARRIADLDAQNAALLAFVNDVMTLDAPANYARAGLETLADKARALLAELDKGEME